MRVWEVVWVTKIFPLHSTDERMLGNVTVNSATAMRNAKCDIQRTRVIKGERSWEMFPSSPATKRSSEIELRCVTLLIGEKLD